LLLRQGINAPGNTLFGLMLLLLCRLILRRGLLVSGAYIVLTTAMFTILTEAHPILGWFGLGIVSALRLWVYLRLGLLAGTVLNLTFDTLILAPLTTDRSAWYAGSGLAVVAIFLALAAFGFYTSQAGRPIFGDAARGRMPN
jgi:hypothetical protein